MPTPSSAAAPTTRADPLPGYVGLPGRYDECRAPDGSLRPHWAEFLRLLGADAPAKFRTANATCRRTIVEQDVSMNVYAGERSDPQPWPLEAVPFLINATEWDTLATGLRQRAHLYNQLLADLYGPQKLLREGSIPPALAMANPDFLRPCLGLGNARTPYLHTYAADLARSPDGQWWVLRDRLDAPSGLGYSLQNRIIARQALPQAFHRAPVHRLYKFLRGFRASLEELAPVRDGEEPLVVFVTPGPANETYFEHAYLARYLGFPLVEGADLTTRDRQVFLRTVGGLRRVDAIVRRVDSSFCDPLELRAQSLLGVPGLVHAAHGGRIAIANQLGCAALDSTALLAFLAPLSRRVLGEDLRLPSVATWWCGQTPARDYVLARLDRLVVKPSFREAGPSATRYGALLNKAERSTFAAEIAARPWAYCGQERVLLGTTPAWVDDQLQPVPFVLRLFVSWQAGDYRVMPGGLTRFNPTGEDAIVSLQRGSVTKDTWVLSAGRADHTLPPATPLADTHYRPADTPSRLADNFFWLGRYLERTAQLARLLEKLDPLLRDEIAALDPTVARASLRLLLTVQGRVAPVDATLEQLDVLVDDAVDDETLPGSLDANLEHLIRNLDQVKVRLPPEAWRILRYLRNAAEAVEPPPLPELSGHLAALEGLANDTLAHDTGWRFLMLGRRLERAQHLVFVARALLVPGFDQPAYAAGTPPPIVLSEFRLQTLLHFADSLFTYRNTFRGSFQAAPVLEWLLSSLENPRSLHFQANRINDHLAALPDELAPRAVGVLRATAFRLVSLVRLLDAPALVSTPAKAATFFSDAAATLVELNDRLGGIYFSHTDFVT